MDGETPEGREALSNWLVKRGLQVEFVLPAGAAVQINGRTHYLQSAVAVRTDDPAPVVEGRTGQGSPEAVAWPPHIQARLKPAVPTDRWCVAMVDLSEGDVRAALNAEPQPDERWDVC